MSEEALAAALEVCKKLHARISDLERTNLLLAEQLKKREGMWLAPGEPDEGMLMRGREAHKSGRIRDIYQAMRDNWLSRNK